MQDWNEFRNMAAYVAKLMNKFYFASRINMDTAHN